MLLDGYCCSCEELIEGDVVWAEGDLAFCEDCADKELVECPYCHDLRFPEHVFVYEGTCKRYFGEKLCIGCIEEVDDIQYVKDHGE